LMPKMPASYPRSTRLSSATNIAAYLQLEALPCLLFQLQELLSLPSREEEEEEEEEFFNHYKNDLKRHAHTPSGVAGADLKS
jgi:hypothetical protein